MALSLNNFPTFSVAALYVGDLHPDVTETMLFEKFSSVGQVVSMHLCRDMVTRRSLGYAYINFQSIVDAERALDTMNFDLLKGRPIRIMWSQRDPSLRRSGVGNVFIKNLEKSIDNKALYDTFAAFGGILSCKIAYDEDGRSKGYGFVHFETTEAAEKAIQKVDGMLLRGKKVYVGKFIPRIEREKQIGERQKLFTNVFVKNFGDELDDEKLREMFASFGTITSSKVMRDDEGASKGFGFVAYENPESAAAAVRELNSKELPNGMVLYVGRAQKKAERQMELRRRYEQLKSERYTASLCTNLFVKNLDDTIDDNRLREEFEKYGTVTSVKVMEEGGRSKGFGFVSYATVEDATRGLREMNGRMVGSKPLYVGLAQRKEDRKAYLAAQRVSQVMHVRTGTYTPCNLFGPCLLHHQRMLHPTPRWNIPPQIRATASPLARVAPMAATVGAVPPTRCTRPRTVTVPTTVPRAVVSATRTMVQGANTAATAPNRTPSLTGYALRSVRSSSSIPQNSIEHKDSNPSQPVVMQGNRQIVYERHFS